MRFSVSGQNVSFNNIPITGSDLEPILAGLDLDAAFLRWLRRPGVSAVSFGEGFSALLHYLIQNCGGEVTAVDTWYHSPDLLFAVSSGIKDLESMALFQQLYGRYLLRATAFATPFARESKTLVLSYRLANNLYVGNQLRLIRESIRILEVGGQARILIPTRRGPIHPLREAALNHFLHLHYAGSVRARFVNGLLILDKVAPVDQSLEPQIDDFPTRFVDLPDEARTRWRRARGGIQDVLSIFRRIDARIPGDVYVRRYIGNLETRLLDLDRDGQALGGR